MEEKLKVICFGMGAIGTYIGGSLSYAGADVVFVERKELIEDIRQKGIRITLPKKVIQPSNFSVTSDITELIGKKKFDVALLAVKSFDTEIVLDSLTGIEDQFPPILCLQNGVENEAAIDQRLGAGKVISGTITSAVGKSAPGDVRLEKLRGVGIEKGHPLSETLIQWFNLAGLRAKGYASRNDMKWSKMLTNLLANASSAILNWTPQQIFSHPLTYKIEVEQLREALEVMDRLKFKVVDLPGSPVAGLAWMMKNLPEGISRRIIGLPLAKARGAKLPSFHIDLYAGRTRSEVTFLNGAVCRFGNPLGVATPVNQVMTDLLEGLSAGTISKESINDQPEKLSQIIRGA